MGKKKGKTQMGCDTTKPQKLTKRGRGMGTKNSDRDRKKSHRKGRKNCGGDRKKKRFQMTRGKKAQTKIKTQSQQQKKGILGKYPNMPREGGEFGPRRGP